MIGSPAALLQLAQRPEDLLHSRAVVVVPADVPPPDDAGLVDDERRGAELPRCLVVDAVLPLERAVRSGYEGKPDVERALRAVDVSAIALCDRDDLGVERLEGPKVALQLTELPQTGPSGVIPVEDEHDMLPALEIAQPDLSVALVEQRELRRGRRLRRRTGGEQG